MSFFEAPLCCLSVLQRCSHYDRRYGVKAGRRPDPTDRGHPRHHDGTPMITWEQINNVLQPAERRRTEPNWTKPL